MITQCIQRINMKEARTIKGKYLLLERMPQTINSIYLLDNRTKVTHVVNYILIWLLSA